MGFRLSEHKSLTIKWISEEEEAVSDIHGELLHVTEPSFQLFHAIQSKLFKKNIHKFSVLKQEREVSIKADYCIGLDWLGATGRYVYVEPKINKKAAARFKACVDSIDAEQKEPIIASNQQSAPETAFDDGDSVEVNYLEMLLDIMSVEQAANHTKDLVQIDWEAKPIAIPQQADHLTPFLVLQFLQLLKAIVRKGLKKSYYKRTENLTSKIKGKILVGQHIKQNVFKNRLTQTYCAYQVFGTDNPENRFLKRVLRFVVSYVENNKTLFERSKVDLTNTLNYCRPAFELIGDDIEEFQLKHFKANPFFKEYKDAVRMGKYILKRFAYNINHTSTSTITTPPFWIDMPALFELYVYQQLLVANNFDTDKIKYQFSTRGNYLDILIKDGNNSMVVDAKYKLAYERGQIHQDIRQVAGYARLDKVLREIEKDNPDFNRDIMLPCLIIYPDTNVQAIPSLKICDLLSKESKQERAIKAYHKVYKLGIRLPLMCDPVK